MKTLGYAACSPDTPLRPFTFERRALRPDDVAIEVLYCGVCHSDLHAVRNDWGETLYPLVPGHEIVGRVLATGAAVTRYRVGETVAVGCMVDSCQTCSPCEAGEEQFCDEMTETYNAPDRISGENTQGGYARHLVVREKFVLRVPEGLDPARTGPLLCAGITSWTPLRVWQVGPGSRVGVIGLGGLGHMAVKLAVALGAEVTVISRSADKAADARALGAARLLVSTDAAAMKAAAATLDLIIDTVPVRHDVMPHVPLLKIDATLVLVGQIGPLDEVHTFPLLAGRRRLAGSHIGGTHETQVLLDFCAEHQILPECEMIRMDQINEAFQRMERGDVRYRFVIDMASLSGPSCKHPVAGFVRASAP